MPASRSVASNWSCQDTLPAQNGQSRREVPKGNLKRNNTDVQKPAMLKRVKEVSKDGSAGVKKPQVPKDDLKQTQMEAATSENKSMEIQDVPKIRWDEKDKRFMFSIKVDGQKLSFQTTCKAAGMQKDAAEQICQLCYEKFLTGAGKQEVIDYRQSLYQKLKSEEALPWPDKKAPADSAPKCESTASSKTCEVQRAQEPDGDRSGLGARSFWTFAVEAMRGAASQNPLCRRFQLEPKLTKAAKLRGSVISRAFSGAKRVLGRADAGWEEVQVVAATQNWAKATIAPLKPLLLPYGHLHLVQVAQLLANFEAVVAFKAEFGFCPVPTSAFPPDWRRRETPNSQEGQKRKAESMATSETVANSDKIEERVPQKKLKITHKSVKEVKDMPTLQERDAVPKAAIDKPKRVKRASEQNAKVSPDIGKQKTPQASTQVKEEAKKKLKPSPKRKAEEKVKANGANKKLKDSEDHKTNQKSSSTTSKQKISKAKVASKKTDVEAPKAKATRTKMAIKKAIKDDKVCSVCGGPSKLPPMSCEGCTSELSKRFQLQFAVGDVVWCSGFGPRWPATVASIGFDGPQDSEPYGVNFCGESNGAWVSGAQLEPWAARQPPSVPARWQRRLKAALQAAQKCLDQPKDAK